MSRSPSPSIGPLLRSLYSATRETVAADALLFYTGRPGGSQHNCGGDAGHRANERSIVFHLARRLVPCVSEVSDLHVDVEYNRHGPGREAVEKAVDHLLNTDEDQRVLPDIIVHRRGDDDANLLVVECKINAFTPGVNPALWCRCAMKEARKLAAYQQAPLNYRAAIFLNFRSNRNSVTLGQVDFEMLCINEHYRNVEEYSV
jgi:hypothetical protein